MTCPPSRFIYLHGFCSGPQSAKAKYFHQRFQTLGLELECPDLNQPEFYHLTLTRQIQQVNALLPMDPESTVLVGSSLGGYTAVLVAEQCPAVAGLVLLAPAFNFLDHWLPSLEVTDLEDWRQGQGRSFYHYGFQREMLLHYGFVEDALQPGYRVDRLKRSLPTLILHGVQDEVIPVEASRQYGHDRPWVTVVELESDHNLANVMSYLWRSSRDFLGQLFER